MKTARAPNLAVSKPSIVSLSFAMMYSLAMASIPDTRFLDWSNYLVYADNSLSILLLNASNGIGSLLTNEPLWLLVNSALRIFFDADSLVRIIVFFSAFVVSCIVLTVFKRNFFLALIVLIYPPIVSFFLTHIRQGLAVSLFLAGCMYPRLSVKIILYVFAMMIHSSFFFIVSFIFLLRLLEKLKFTWDIKIISFVFYGLCISFFLENIVVFMGARQGLEYEFEAIEISGLGFLFWLVVMIIMICEGRVFLDKNFFSIATVSFYLSTYFSFEVAARIFESSVICVFFSAFSLSKWRFSAFLVLIVFFEIFIWVSKLAKPLMGYQA